MPRRNAESSSHETIGSQKWIMKTIALVAALALGWAVTAQLGRVKSLEEAVTTLQKESKDYDKRIDRHENEMVRIVAPKLADHATRIDRIERPRPWERQPSGRR